MALFQPISFSPADAWDWKIPRFPARHHDSASSGEHDQGETPSLQHAFTSPPAAGGRNRNLSPHLPSFSLKRRTTLPANPVTITPAFDIRESETHYSAEGDCAGLDESQNFSLQWTGRRTLEITATVSAIDLGKERGAKGSAVSSSAFAARQRLSGLEEEGEEENTGKRKEEEEAKEDDGEGEEDLSLHRCLSHDECKDEHHFQQKQQRQQQQQQQEEQGKQSRRHSETTKTERSNSTASTTSSKASTSKTSLPGFASLKRHLSWSPKMSRRASHPDTSTLSPTVEQNSSRPNHVWAKEKNAGNAKRVLTFPKDVDHDSVQVKSEDGVLRVRVAKNNEHRPVKARVRLWENSMRGYKRRKMLGAVSI